MQEASIHIVRTRQSHKFLRSRGNHAATDYSSTKNIPQEIYFSSVLDTTICFVVRTSIERNKGDENHKKLMKQKKNSEKNQGKRCKKIFMTGKMDNMLLVLSMRNETNLSVTRAEARNDRYTEPPGERLHSFGHGDALNEPCTSLNHTPYCKEQGRLKGHIVLLVILAACTDIVVVCFRELEW